MKKNSKRRGKKALLRLQYVLTGAAVLCVAVIALLLVYSMQDNEISGPGSDAGSALLVSGGNAFVAAGEDAVSAVIPEAVIYMPFAELVDIDKEIERLKKEEERLTKELARVNGMLGNEKFVSKAPQAKIDEEKAKLEKYTQMMDQVKARLAQLA